MQILVLGANGLLGSNVVTHLQLRNWDVSGTYHSKRPAFDIPCFHLDIRDTDAVQEVIVETEPDWVVNCAAMTDVDRCEESPRKAYDINAHAPGEIAELCAQEGTRFIQVSTDYVFDGNVSRKYREDDSTDPVQTYGESKLMGERAVSKSDAVSLITRLSFVYGVHRSKGRLTGFPAWVLRKLDKGEQTSLFTDQHVTPTRAGQAAETFGELIETGESGTFHVASRSCITPYEFGMNLGQFLDADTTLLTEGSQDAVKREGKRPSNTCLDVSRLEKVLDRLQPTMKEDLVSISWAFE